jgi:hypothetical protein
MPQEFAAAMATISFFFQPAVPGSDRTEDFFPTPETAGVNAAETCDDFLGSLAAELPMAGLPGNLGKMGTHRRNYNYDKV